MRASDPFRGLDGVRPPAGSEADYDYATVDVYEAFADMETHGSRLFQVEPPAQVRLEGRVGSPGMVSVSA